MKPDLHSQFAEAQHALQSEDFDRALTILRTLAEHYPEQPALYHLTGLALKKKGDSDRALAAFEQGLAVNDTGAGLHAERASLLADKGRPEEAIIAYDRALELAPDMLDARIDRAVVRHKQIDAAGGYRELCGVAEEHADHPRILINLAIMARQIGKIEESQEAVEALLKIDPDHIKGLRLRAQLALDCGKPAAQLFEIALRHDPDDPASLSGLAAALATEGRRDEGEALLADALKRRPQWHEGHHLLAELRWQSGAGDAFVESYRDALKDYPRDSILWSDMIVAVARAIGHDQALPLYEEARANAGEDSYFDNLEANSLSELGELEKAGKIYERIAHIDDDSYRLPLIRYCLRSRDFERARDYGLDLVERGHGPDAWPYVSTAWRMLDDPRWQWLEGDPRLTAALDLDGLVPELPELAAHLRSLHKATTHPFEQSLRGGTQTDAILFTRTEPEIVSLVGHIREAVATYIGQLPPPDETHPVLSRPRGDFRFTGSWSVRLSDAGFHVSHYHNQGWISSALYVALPDSIGHSEDDDDGWLALGEPPAEFALNLPALRMVEPRPGRLALFPSIMWHGTRPFSAGERLTVAFDVAPV